ncbi:RTA1 like protein [Exophiala sideris]|uniref:RTA1 like protein n=1 Tax=Exophiala sideris TaxID=1016849 RepID=A0ABR0J4M9_9EURO|nr:RTA1 like protein [Exophiala sideris]KAK5056360.1 RTA1 like protein [Exophiala sideris]
MNNSTAFDPTNCTYATCSVQEWGQLAYIPSLAGNALYLAIFSLTLIAQLILGVYHGTWGFMVGVVAGNALEILGYAYRIELHYDDFNNNSFIIYLVGLTIAPAFYSGAIYLCLARIIAVYGTSLSLLSPRAITTIFIGCDFLSLVLQAAGGAVASLAISKSLLQTGINIMIAGLSTQVVSTTAFCCICLQMMFRVARRPSLVNQNSQSLRKTLKFRFFLWALAIATVAILIRCSFRVAELSKGFGSSIANNQVEFMVLDGAMMSIAVMVLTLGHPGPALGNMWQQGNFKLCGSRKSPPMHVEVCGPVWQQGNPSSVVQESRREKY